MLLSLPLGVVAAVIALRDLISSNSERNDSVKSRIDQSWELLVVVGTVGAAIGILWIDSMLWIGLIAIEIGLIGRYRRSWKRQ